MNENQVRQQLGSLINTRKKVRLNRCFPNEPRHNGFVLALGREWVLLQQFHDFYPEGYTTLRVQDITDIRSGEHERHWERMLAAEGLLDLNANFQDVLLDDISQLLIALQERGQNIIIESEDPFGDKEDFYIGKILSVDEKSVCFANFDALGNWDESPDMISYDEITKVEFETPYIQLFSKYLTGTIPKIK